MKWTASPFSICVAFCHIVMNSIYLPKHVVLEATVACSDIKIIHLFAVIMGYWGVFLIGGGGGGEGLTPDLHPRLQLPYNSHMRPINFE